MSWAAVVFQQVYHINIIEKLQNKKRESRMLRDISSLGDSQKSSKSLHATCKHFIGLEIENKIKTI